MFALHRGVAFWVPDDDFKEFWAERRGMIKPEPEPLPEPPGPIPFTSRPIAGFSLQAITSLDPEHAAQLREQLALAIRDRDYSVLTADTQAEQVIGEAAYQVTALRYGTGAQQVPVVDLMVRSAVPTVGADRTFWPPNIYWVVSEDVFSRLQVGQTINVTLSTNFPNDPV